MAMAGQDLKWSGHADVVALLRKAGEEFSITVVTPQHRTAHQVRYSSTAQDSTTGEIQQYGTAQDSTTGEIQQYNTPQEAEQVRYSNTLQRSAAQQVR